MEKKLETIPLCKKVLIFITYSFRKIWISKENHIVPYFKNPVKHSLWCCIHAVFSTFISEKFHFSFFNWSSMAQKKSQWQCYHSKKPVYIAITMLAPCTHTLLDNYFLWKSKLKELLLPNEAETLIEGKYPCSYREKSRKNNTYPILKCMETNHKL